MITSELQRILAVKRFETYNFNANDNFRNILKLTAEIFDTPAAFISLLDEHNQWLKVTHGYELLCTPRVTSFCTHAINQDNVLIVGDATADERFRENPFVINAPHIRFYGGAPLTTTDGYNIGTLCVMDVRPKEISSEKSHHLEILAKQVINLMELELAQDIINEKINHIRLQNETLSRIAHIQSHDFRGPLSSMMGIMNVIKESDYHSSREYLQMMEQAINTLDHKIQVVTKSIEAATATT